MTKTESLFEKKADSQAPVQCLGVTFINDGERRRHYSELLREKLSDANFRNSDGFPIGTDDDILALSDPPYYTACPNPFISDFISHFGSKYDPSVQYRKEPFATDVSEGKNDPIYNAHALSLIHISEPTRPY